MFELTGLELALLAVWATGIIVWATAIAPSHDVSRLRKVVLLAAAVLLPVLGTAAVALSAMLHRTDARS